MQAFLNYVRNPGELWLLGGACWLVTPDPFGYNRQRINFKTCPAAAIYGMAVNFYKRPCK